MNLNKTNSYVVAFALLALMMLSLPLTVRAEGEKRDAVDVVVSPEQMLNSLKGVLASQRAELADLKVSLQQLETRQAALQTEINVYDSQDTSHGQLLLASQPRIDELENALKNNRLASKRMAELVEMFQERYDATTILIQKTAERMELAQKQIADIRKFQFANTQKQQLKAATGKLLQVFQEKKRLGERYLKIYGELLIRIKAALEAKKAIGEKLATRLESRRKASLFTRFSPYRELRGQAFKETLRLFGSRIGAVFSPALWKVWWDQIKMGGVAHWAGLLLALALILALQSRCRAFLRQVEERLEGPGWYYRRLGLLLLHRSLPYLSMTLLFGVYCSFQLSPIDMGLRRFLFYFFRVLLITRWGLDYLEYGFSGPPTGLRSFVSLHLNRFFRFFRATVIGLTMLIWVAGMNNLLIWMAQVVLSIVFLAWAVVFWRQMKPVVVEGVRHDQAGPNPKRMALIRRWIYLVLGVTLLLNLAGYGYLTNHWIIAWILNVVLLLWGWISLNAIREWHRDHRAKGAAADDDHPLGSAHYLRWTLIQLIRLVWFISLAAGLVWAWDRSGALMSCLGRFFHLSFVIGSLKISIKGIVLAIVILHITYVAVRLGRSLLSEKILDKKPLEHGFKDSLLTITGYLGWGVGLILALGTLGINATSLAVVFGAISIGIGFGLQNIFNNFISGLILLFERPFQVGDYVEMSDGLWAEVKEINVRATVVQTFDNASVIIPNSDFISQRLTNWSFKDKRMRRNIEVGVAYGSDIDLVEKTLLEIANNTQKVLKYPRHQVLFIDHADSALIFRLRIWVHVDDYWAVPSQIRYEIDRRFRELAIEIAFPQRDLHIRTIPKEITPAASTGEAEPGQ
jgi:small-conductance mechanosensitive channel